MSKPTFNDVADSGLKSTDPPRKCALARRSSREILHWNSGVTNSGVDLVALP